MNKENITRRPLKSRETKWAKFLSQWLIKIGLNPNQVSLASLIFAILAGIFLLGVKFALDIKIKMAFYFIAAGCIQLRLLCNLLDGMMAIEGGLKTKWGYIFNDLPDRIADVIILVCAGYSLSMIPYGNYLGWFAAITAVITAYIRVLGGSLGTEQFFIGPMAKQHRMAVLTIGCIISGLTLTFSFGMADLIMAISLILIIIGSLITSLRRLLRIVKDLRI